MVTELIWLTGSWLDLTRNFRLDLTLCLRLDLALRFRLDLSHCFRLNSSHSYWLDLTHFFGLIWLTSNALIFDSSYKNSVPLQSGFRESQVGQGVLKKIQHWNSGSFTIPRTKIGFGKDTHKNRKVQRRETKAKNIIKPQLIQWQLDSLETLK